MPGVQGHLILERGTPEIGIFSTVGPSQIGDINRAYHYLIFQKCK